MQTRRREITSTGYKSTKSKINKDQVNTVGQQASLWKEKKKQIRTKHKRVHHHGNYDAISYQSLMISVIIINTTIIPTT